MEDYGNKCHFTMAARLSRVQTISYRNSLLFLYFVGFMITARELTKHAIQNHERRTIMPKYVIEREIPGVGKLTPQQLREISGQSRNVLRKLGPEIQWLHSYVTDDRVYCLYIAPNEAMLQEHAKQGGFPLNRVSQVRQVIDPTTAE